MSGYVQIRIRTADESGPLFADWRLRAFLNLTKRADYRTREVRASGRTLALAWDVEHSAAVRWLRALEKAGYVASRKAGDTRRSGRVLVLLDIAEDTRHNDRHKSETIDDTIAASIRNDLRDSVPQSATQKRNNRRHMSKEGRNRIEETISLKGDGKDAADEPPRSLALVVVDGLTDEQRETANAMLRAWIDHYTRRAGAPPAGPTIAKQGAIARQLAGKYTREQLGRAFKGMDAHWKFKDGRAWTLLNLAADFDDVFPLAMQSPEVKQAVEDAEFYALVNARRMTA